MKPPRNRLQARVLQRLEAGLPLTRWQQFCLHVQMAWRHRRKQNIQRIMFHLRGMVRVFLQRNRKK